MITSSSGTGMLTCAAPPNHWMTKKPMYAPTMYRSPCAKLSSFSTPYTMEKPSAISAYSAPVVTPVTSSPKKSLIRRSSRHHVVLRRGPAGPRPRRRHAPSSADHELGISWYLPDVLILNRKNLPLTRSPWGSKEVGWPRVVVDSFVFLIAASTLARLGVCPAWQSDEIASSTTCVAANTGPPTPPTPPPLPSP